MEKQLTCEGEGEQRQRQSPATGVTLTPGNSKAGGYWLEMSSAGKAMVHSKLNMRQQCTLMAVKDNSILDSKSVARRCE